MNQLLILILLATMLMALYMTPGQANNEEIEASEAWIAAETNA